MSAKKGQVKAKAVETTQQPAKAMSIDELRVLSEKSKDNFEGVFAEACDKAMQEVLKDYQDKMRIAASKGHTRAYLYVWKYVEDKTDKSYTFNNIRILDLLTKGGSTQYQGLLTQKLREFFNPNREKDGYYVSFHRFEKREPAQYGIYVSWYKSDGKNKTENDAEHQEAQTDAQ